MPYLAPIPVKHKGIKIPQVCLADRLTESLDGCTDRCWRIKERREQEDRKALISRAVGLIYGTFGSTRPLWKLYKLGIASLRVASLPHTSDHRTDSEVIEIATMPRRSAGRESLLNMIP